MKLTDLRFALDSIGDTPPPRSRHHSPSAPRPNVVTLCKRFDTDDAFEVVRGIELAARRNSRAWKSP
jgi:hypothetical protein